MKLTAQNYGKQRVRVMKVLRGTPRHVVKELEIGVRLEGDFAAAYTSADNRNVVATDTMKNIVQALAHRHLGPDTEPFAQLLARHFLLQYPQVTQVTVDAKERAWSRIIVDGREHDHSFTSDLARPLVRVIAARERDERVESGIEDLLIMKSTHSGFAGFAKDEFTTLPETSDRILATQLRAMWTWTAAPADFASANAAILRQMLRVFALNHSPSVQATLFEMAQAAFQAESRIGQLTLAMPNKHYLPAKLEPFGMKAEGVSFVPTDEPHGQIEATFLRQG